MLDPFVRQRLTRRRLLSRAAGATGAAVVASTTPGFATRQGAVAQDTSSDAGEMLAAPEPDPKRGGVIKVSSFGDPAHFDLDQSPSIVNLWPQSSMYDNLIRFNPLDGGETIIPDLAHRWEVSDDGLTYTFYLREGVTFHDGEPFTADDVIATFDRRRNPPEGVVSIRQNLFGAVSTIEALDPLTVQFVLSEPQAFFLEAIATGWSVVLSKKSLEENNGDLRRIPDYPGTGPYRFVDFTSGEGWIVERNPDYWNPDLPYVDRMERISIIEANDRGTAALTGEVDLADHVSVGVYKEAQNRPDEVGSVLHTTTWAFTVTFNTNKPPFDDPRVRRAVHLAISRQQLAAVYEEAEAINAGTRWCHPSSPHAMAQGEILELPGYRPDKDEDIAEAKRLMEEAGYGDGVQDLDFLQRGLSGPGIEIYAPAFQDLIRRDLNIGLVIKPIETSVYWDAVRAGDFHATAGVPAGAINDPSDYWGQWFKTDGPQNYAGWSNAEFDDLLAQINRELDMDTRTGLVRQAEELLDQECPMYFHGWALLPRIWQPAVKGIEQNMAGTYLTYRYDTIWLDR